jgi:hypothetical protein
MRETNTRMNTTRGRGQVLYLQSLLVTQLYRHSLDPTFHESMYVEITSAHHRLVDTNNKTKRTCVWNFPSN